MRYAWPEVGQKLRGRLNLLCTSLVAIDQSEYSVQWFAFLNKRLQRGRDGHSGNEGGTYDKTYKYSQPVTYMASQLHIWPASHNSFALVGGLGPTNQ